MATSDREYRILVAQDRAGVTVLASGGWTLLESTVKEFMGLDTNDDQSFGDLGRVATASGGWVGLAWRKQPSP